VTGADPLALHRDDGVVAARIPSLGTSSTAAVVCTGLAVVGLLAAAAVGARGAVLGLAALALVGALVADASSAPTRFAWLVPPTLRAVEYGTALGLAWVDPDPSARIAVVAYLGAVLFHHYDVVYRSVNGGRRPLAVVVALLGGWEGRTAVVLCAAAVGVLPGALWVLAVWCGLLAVLESAWSWRAGADVDP
jgi:hypothetical protein